MARKIGVSIAILLIGFLSGVLVVSYSLSSSAAPESCETGDVNGDGQVDMSDAVSLLGFLFLGDEPPSICPCVPDTATVLSTVVVVRHAEKDTKPIEDPGLTPEGQARAERPSRSPESRGTARKSDSWQLVCPTAKDVSCGVRTSRSIPMLLRCALAQKR